MGNPYPQEVAGVIEDAEIAYSGYMSPISLNTFVEDGTLAVSNSSSKSPDSSQVKVNSLRAPGHSIFWYEHSTICRRNQGSTRLQIVSTLLPAGAYTCEE